jgi:hypothetical protein
VTDAVRPSESNPQKPDELVQPLPYLRIQDWHNLDEVGVRTLRWLLAERTAERDQARRVAAWHRENPDYRPFPWEVES